MLVFVLFFKSIHWVFTYTYTHTYTCTQNGMASEFFVFVFKKKNLPAIGDVMLVL